MMNRSDRRRCDVKRRETMTLSAFGIQAGQQVRVNLIGSTVWAVAAEVDYLGPWEVAVTFVYGPQVWRRTFRRDETALVAVEVV